MLEAECLTTRHAVPPLERSPSPPFRFAVCALCRVPPVCVVCVECCPCREPWRIPNFAFLRSILGAGPPGPRPKFITESPFPRRRGRRPRGMSLPAADCASVLAGEVPAASVQTLCERLASAVEEETAFATFRHTSDWVRATAHRQARCAARPRGGTRSARATPCPAPRLACRRLTWASRSSAC